MELVRRTEAGIKSVRRTMLLGRFLPPVERSLDLFLGRFYLNRESRRKKARRHQQDAEGAADLKRVAIMNVHRSLRRLFKKIG
jgi:hypothetical protein